MFKGDEIQSVITLFEKRRVTLYHACHLIDLESYFELGGIPSRNLLRTENLSFESLGLDQTEPDDWMWDKVPLQLIDFGNQFAREPNNLPNPYGPILLEIDPAALMEAKEVAICLRTGRPDDYRKNNLSTLNLEETEHIFRYTLDAPFPEKTYFKPAEEMAKAFGANQSIPEIHCLFEPEKLPFKYVTQMLVDNYRIINSYLREWAFMTQQHYHNRIPIMQRYCPYDIGGKLTNAIAKLLTEASPSLEDLAQSENDVVQPWAKFLLENGWEEKYTQFATGLRQGTILPVKEQQLKVANQTSESPKTLFSKQTRELIQKLLNEKVPVASIARIADTSEEDIRDYIRHVT
jgi:hypothetical protein